VFVSLCHKRGFLSVLLEYDNPQKAKLLEALNEVITELTFFFSNPLSGKKTESEYS